MKTPRAVILAFDLGTTNLKAALFDEAGRLIAVERCPTPAIATFGRVELPVDRLCDHLTGLVQRLGTRADLQSVRGISFASQANSFALLDDQNKPLTPIILWTDDRARSIDQPLNQRADLHATTGVPSVNHAFAQSKLRWIAKNESSRMARARKISFISDVLVEWLTGKHVSEYGLACLTALATYSDAGWSFGQIEELGIPTLQWPAVLRAGTDVGLVVPAIAQRMGLPSGIHLYMGCLDQYAGAIGTGAVLPGAVCETTGTVLAAVQCAAAEGSGPRPRVFEGPSFAPDRIFRMTFSSTSANLLEWYRNTHMPDATFDQLITLASASRERAAIGSVTSTAAEAFSPADFARGPGFVVSGIMHRVCDELAWLLSELDAEGVPIRSSGGAARSELWLQMKADRLCVPVLAASTDEPTCRGAAMLAASGMRLGSIDVLAEQWCRPSKVFQPIQR